MADRPAAWPRHGLRHARRPARRRGVLHPHPPGPPADPRAARRPRARATTPSAASRRSPSAPRPSAPRSRPPLDERAPGRFRVVLGQKHAAPFIEDAVADAGRRRRRPHRRAGARPALLAASVGQYQARLATAAEARGVRGRTASTAGTSSRPTSTSSPRAVRDALADAAGPHQGALHRPLPARAGARRRPLPRPAARSGGGGGRGGRARPWAGWSIALAEGRAHRRAVAGTRHPRGDPRPRRHRPRRRRARLPAGVRDRPPRGGLRPRHRGARPSPTRSGWPSPARACSTTTPRSWAPSPTGSSPPRR